MSNTIKLDIAASDNGSIDKVTAKTKALNKELTKAQSTAGSLGKPATGTKAYAAAKAQTDDMFEYRQARGARGTGAEGRDFAKQAQGLGGLVHVYATFAANLFAVSAAFTALSKAADYTNMVKGLDQLGAASGRNLGTMAKSVVELTDGAVSLKEAMASVAQASSAGMNNSQIERLALGAKKASQALGRDVGDSLNRLSRGISKIEPELLDELGIFVRVDKAAADYARSIGKTASSLSDFERRQAFAVAALSQMEEKFGSINLDANPYNKLLASFIDLAYAGGELVNKVLGPIAKALASSPVALGAAMAGIAGVLLKQAIPALTQWRTKLVEAAEADAQLARQLANSQQQYNINKQLGNLDTTLAPIQQAAAASISSIQTALGKALPETSKLVQKAFSEGFAPTEKDLKNYKTALSKAQRELEKIPDSTDMAKMSDTEKNAQLAINKAIKERIGYLEIANREAAKAIQLAAQEREIHLASLNAMDKANFLSEERLNEKIAADAERKSRKSQHLATFSSNVRDIGTFAAFEQLDKDLKKDLGEQKLNKLDAGIVKVKAGLAGLVGGVSKVIQAFSGYAVALTVLYVAFEIFDTMLSKTGKQMEALNTQLDASEDSIANFGRTVQKNIHEGNSQSINSTHAFATALSDLADNTTDIIVKYKELRKVMEDSPWDSGKNWIASLFGGGAEKNSAKAVINNVMTALSAQTDPKIASALQSKIQGALGSDDKMDRKTLIGRLSEEIEKGNWDKIKEIEGYLSDLAKSTSKAANNLKSFQVSSDNAVKSLQNLRNSFIPNDVASRLGMDMISMAKDFDAAGSTVEGKLKAIGDILDNPEKLSLFSPEDSENMIKFSNDIKNTQTSIGLLDSQLLKLKETRQKIIDQGYSMEEVTGYSYTAGTYTTNEKVKAQDSKTLKQANTDIPKLEAQRQKLLDDMSQTMSLFDTTANNAFRKGADLVSQGIKLASQQASLEYGKTIAGFLKGPIASEVQTKLQLQEIGLQQQMIKVNMELYLATERLRIATEQSRVEQELNRGSLLPADESKLQAQKTALEKEKALFYKKNDKGDEAPRSALEVSKAVGPGGEFEKSFSSVGLVLKGFEAQLSSLGSKASGVKLAGEVKTLGEKTKSDNDTLDTSTKALAAYKEELNLATQLSDIYDGNLESAKIAIQEEINKNNIQKLNNEIALEEATKAKVLNAAKASGHFSEKEYQQAEIQYTKYISELERKRDAEKKTNETNIIRDKLANIDKEFVAKEKLLDLELKIYDLQSSAVDKQAAVKITTSTIQRKAELDIIKQTAATQLKIAENRKMAESTKDTAAAKQYKEHADYLEKVVELDKQKIQLEADYQAALIKTEQTLRSLESAGQYTGQYFGAMYQDFSNQINALVNASKSAASAFNEGFINAIDSSIDEFFKMMQEGTLKMEDMVNFMRNALSDVFRDTASQIMKNSWKDMLKGFLPKSDQDKATDRYVTATNELASSVERLNSTMSGAGTSILGPAVGPKISDKDYASQDVIAAKLNSDAGFSLEETAAVQQTTAAELQLKAANLGMSITTSFADDMMGIVNGTKSVTEVFGKYIGSFGQYIMQMLAGAASGGGEVPGWFQAFSTIVKVGVAAYTGGAGAAGASFISSAAETAGTYTTPVSDPYAGMTTEALAKGGVVDSPSLSAYSNSIVSSPTLFAFAKGSTGLMGEAGPEAIIPLKRDSSGNLGISGGGGMTNDIDINITIENGQASSGGPNDKQGSSKQASALAAAIKGAVTQELINQSRPGGLLAR